MTLSLMSSKFLIFTVLFLVGFYFANDHGYMVGHHSSTQLNLIRYGTPVSVPFVVDIVSDPTTDPEIKIKTAYKNATFFIHLFNGPIWFLVYILIYYWHKRRKKERVMRSNKAP